MPPPADDYYTEKSFGLSVSQRSFTEEATGKPCRHKRMSKWFKRQPGHRYFEFFCPLFLGALCVSASVFMLQGCTRPDLFFKDLWLLRIKMGDDESDEIRLGYQSLCLKNLDAEWKCYMFVGDTPDLREKLDAISSKFGAAMDFAQNALTNGLEIAAIVFLAIAVLLAFINFCLGTRAGFRVGCVYWFFMVSTLLQSWALTAFWAAARGAVWALSRDGQTTNMERGQTVFNLHIVVIITTIILAHISCADWLKTVVAGLASRVVKKLRS